MRYSSLASYILSSTPPSKADLSSNNVLIARLTQGQTDHCSDRKIFIFVSRKKIKNFLSGALQSRLGGVNPVPAGTQKREIDSMSISLSRVVGAFVRGCYVGRRMQSDATTSTERGLWGETSPHVIGANRNERLPYSKSILSESPSNQLADMLNTSHILIMCLTGIGSFSSSYLLI